MGDAHRTVFPVVNNKSPQDDPAKAYAGRRLPPAPDTASAGEKGVASVLLRPEGIGIAVIGAGDQAKIIISAAESAGLKIDVLLDQDPGKNSQWIEGYPVEVYTLATLADLLRDRAAAIIAIGDNLTRKQLAASLAGVTWATVAHRAAIVDPRCRVGPGTVLCAGSIINPDAHVGDHVIINTAAVVEHDVIVGDYCHIAPNATLCGNVTIGEGTMVGAGSVVLPNRSVGAWCQVGAGAVVTRDVPPGTTVVGVPIRI